LLAPALGGSIDVDRGSPWPHKTHIDEAYVSSEVLFPKLGFSMNEGVLAEWLVQDGAAVKEGQAIYSVESDKSTEEIESPATGTLKILGQAGETYQVGAVIGEIS
jgi:pyruvate/2-oxoglutarate dehydrogenase complex dihydrolipoamide acyltransferase (E2) component